MTELEKMDENIVRLAEGVGAMVGILYKALRALIELSADLMPPESQEAARAILDALDEAMHEELEDE